MVVAIISFFLFPFLCFPLYAFLYIFDKKRGTIIYSLLLAVVFGILSYYMIPKADFDLYRLHGIVKSVSIMNFEDFLTNISKYDLEIIPLFYSYFISIFDNVNLLQFFVVGSGYFSLFYILSDYRKITKIKSNYVFFLITINIIFGLNILYFFSGLYCYLAMILFSLIYYLDNYKYKNNKKSIFTFLYLLLPFIHSSMFIPVLLLLLYKLKNRLTIKQIILCFILFLTIYPIMIFINSYINATFINRLIMMYDSYVFNNEHYILLYQGNNLIIEAIKIIIVPLSIILNKDKEKCSKTNGFIILLVISLLMLLPKSIVSIRYAMLIHFLGIFPMFDLCCNNKKSMKKIAFIILLIAINIFYIMLFYKTIRFFNFGDFFDYDFYKNIFIILE